MQQHFTGEVTFHDCKDVMLLLGGESDDAEFVQLVQGRLRDRDQRGTARKARGSRPRDFESHRYRSEQANRRSPLIMMTGDSHKVTFVSRWVWWHATGASRRAAVDHTVRGADARCRAKSVRYGSRVVATSTVT